MTVKLLTYAQPDQSLCKSLQYSMTVKLLTEHHLEVLSLKGGCTGSSESTLVKMPDCWKSHATAQFKDITPLTEKQPRKRFIPSSSKKQLQLDAVSSEMVKPCTIAIYMGENHRFR